MFRISKKLMFAIEAVLDIGRHRRRFLIGIVIRHDGADANPTVAQCFFGVELRRALGADRGAAAEIVELRRAVWADLFGAQFRIGQCGDLLFKLF